ncbi:MAG: FAD/NAD(P)-binding protein, partial [Pseudomonadota bacterium]
MGKPSSGETGLIATHVIVGDGITALAFLESCRLCPGDTVLLLGRNASEFGRGVAYAKGQVGTPWRFAYLLNSPADDIDPAFADWLAQRWTMVQDVMQGRAPNWLAAAAPLVEAGDIHGVNAPREFYGDFMREQARATIARLERQGTQVRTLDDAATTLSVASDGITLTTAAGRTITAATVDVAPGGPSTLRIDGDDGPFSAPTVFGQEARIADHIKAGREIFCIGGNASMLDVLRLCQSLIPDEALRFVACAPDGDIPAPLIPRVPRKLTQPVLTTGHQTAQTLLDEIWHAIESAKAAGDGMREIRAGFRAHFLAHPLTSYLPNPEEARRVPATLRFWLRGGTRDTILDMHRLVSAGKAQMVPGFVTAVEHGPTGATVHISDGRDT